jgi:hypothetical protein
VQADYLRADADEATVARHLEAYLLWLFGWVLFCSSHGTSAPKTLIPYARAIAEAPLEDVPQFSWGSAVLAATYRGLCAGCFKVASLEPIFLGCPLLVQLWSYERFSIGRPRIHVGPYEPLPPEHDHRDRPTMGSMWCLRKVRQRIIILEQCYFQLFTNLNIICSLRG